MREELDRELVVNGISIASAIAQVESVVRDWSAKYVHITRAITVHQETSIKFITAFSMPTTERPVPSAVVRVKFHLDTCTQDMLFQFEDDCVQHRVGGHSLASHEFEAWLDRIVRDKQAVQKYHSLTTCFEQTRLAPPPAYDSQASTEAESGHSEDDGDDATRLAQMGLERLQREATAVMSGLSMSDLLSNIFDACDEKDEEFLTHKEVADLLYATALGLTAWDVKLLLTTTIENNAGKIEYRSFVQSAPEIIEALVKRRSAYIARKQPTAEVALDAIELCYGEEIEELSRGCREAFVAMDTDAKKEMSRYKFKSCLQGLPERLSPQEVRMLMQMAEENDFGQVPYEGFTHLVQQLRIDALRNALVETDVASLRVHIILLLRREGLDRFQQMEIWTLRKVLLSADQLILSRMQVHVILSVVHPNLDGWVDVNYFLRVVCTVIPYMFDAATFMEMAALIAKEKADAQAKAELEELQGLAGTRKKSEDDDGADDDKANAPDREAVEKQLIHLGTLQDPTLRNGVSTLDIQQFQHMMRHEGVQQCQLSESEIRGFIAEADMEKDREIAYIEHIKTWVPIIFELRRARVYDSILSRDWGMKAEHLVDLGPYELQFPVLPPEVGAHDRSGSRRGSRIGTLDSSGRRGSRSQSRSGSNAMFDAARLSRSLNRASQRFMSQSNSRRSKSKSRDRFMSQRSYDRESSNGPSNASSRRGSRDKAR